MPRKQPNPQKRKLKAEAEERRIAREEAERVFKKRTGAKRVISIAHPSGATLALLAARVLRGMK